MSRGGDDICPLGFAPHSVRPTRCKRCFRDYSEHRKKGEKEMTKPPAFLTPPPDPVPEPVPQQIPEPVITPTTPEPTADAGQANSSAVRRRRPRPVEEEPTTRVRVRTRPGSWSYSTDTDQGALKMKNLASHYCDETQLNSPDVEFILEVKRANQKKEGDEEEEDALSTAPTETTITMVGEGAEDLRVKIQELSERCTQLELKNRQLEGAKRCAESDSAVLDKAAGELLSLRAELFALKTKEEDSRDENNSLRLQVRELRQELDSRPDPQHMRRTVSELEGKLHAAEALCEELMDENEAIKREMRDMEDELDEMQDNFREEQADEYRDLKKELEQASKNCRILQFKMRKCERRSEQLELDNAELQQKIAAGGDSEGLVLRVAQLQAELNAARQETKPQIIQEGVGLPPLRGHPDGGSNKDDPGQLLRELCDSVERERDLREQLKFSEEEAKSLRKKLTTVEEENESLVMQMKKMAKTRRTTATGEETEAEDVRLQLELNEQETLLLRNKLQQTSADNERLRADLTKAQEKVEELVKPEKSVSHSSTTFADLDTESLRQEASELRRKILQSERENESLKTQLEAFKGSSRRGSKAAAFSQRSKSLDGDVQLDVRRQLQLVEQEAAILRQKVVDLEAHNDRLSTENASLQMRSAHKAPKVPKASKVSKGHVETQTSDWEEPSRRKHEEAEAKVAQLSGALEEARKQMDADKEKLKLVDTRRSEVAVGWLKEREDLKKQLLIEQKRCRDTEETLKNAETRDRQLMEQLRSKAADGELRVLEAEATAKEASDKWRQIDEALRRDKDLWRTERMDLEDELKAERKGRLRAEREHEDEVRDRDQEVTRLKERLKKLTDKTSVLEESLGDVEKELAREKREYEELSGKYDMLEEDYVVIKAQLVMDKEKVENSYNILKRQHQEVEGELRTLRETFNHRQDAWIKEKLDMQDRMKELLGKLARPSSDVNRDRFKEILQEKTSLVEQLKKEDRLLRDDVDRLRRQTEDQRKMLDDYERLHSFGSRALAGDRDRQLLQMQDDLQQAGKKHRSEVTALKMEHEQKFAVLQDELHTAHSQLSKLMRQRDTYVQMLEGAKRNLSEMKSDNMSGARNSAVQAEIEELKESKVSIQDQLDEALRTCSKLTVDLLNEKMNAAQTRTKLNELEEATILQGGKSRIFGVKAKLELAWQKEREEQHKLLNEAHKMALDLKQRLLAVEGLRDQERLEAKRTVDDLRRSLDLQREDTEARSQELKGDLVDLRDNLAKMRGAHERVRREKDRSEREKEELRALLAEARDADDLHRAVFSALLDEVHRVESCSQNLLGASKKTDADKAKNDLKEALIKVAGVVDEMRRSLRAEDEQRAKRARALVVKRATPDTESDTTGGDRSLYRKSVSLDQNLSSEGAIWERPTPSPRTRRTRRPQLTPSTSVESDDASEVSLAESEQSAAAVSEAASKKSSSGVRHALKRLTKSHSVEEEGPKRAEAPSPSLRSKLSGLFRRTPSRSGSVDRSEPDSLDKKIKADTSRASATLPRFGGSAGALHLHRVQDRK